MNSVSRTRYIYDNLPNYSFLGLVLIEDLAKYGSFKFIYNIKI